MAFDLGSFMQRELAKTAVPSRKAVKVRSGKAGRRAANGQKWLASVGGLRSDTAAIYAPADYEMCKVVSHDVGWNADGTPRREPRW
jgi:hypothetical protein